MTAEQRERFLSLNYTDHELEIRDRLMRPEDKAVYKIVITEENEENDFEDCLFSPGLGTYIDTIYFSNPREFNDIIKLYEGLFYELYTINNGQCIGSGMLDPDSPVEEIRSVNLKCYGVCDCCFFKGLLYNENEKDADGSYSCYLNEWIELEKHWKKSQKPKSKHIIQIQFDMMVDDDYNGKELEDNIRSILEKHGYNIVGGPEIATSWSIPEYGLACN